MASTCILYRIMSYASYNIQHSSIYDITHDGCRMSCPGYINGPRTQVSCLRRTVRHNIHMSVRIHVHTAVCIRIQIIHDILLRRTSYYMYLVHAAVLVRSIFEWYIHTASVDILLYCCTFSWPQFVLLAILTMQHPHLQQVLLLYIISWMMVHAINLEIVILSLIIIDSSSIRIVPTSCICRYLAGAATYHIQTGSSNHSSRRYLMRSHDRATAVAELWWQCSI